MIAFQAEHDRERIAHRRIIIDDDDLMSGTLRHRSRPPRSMHDVGGAFRPTQHHLHDVAPTSTGIISAIWGIDDTRTATNKTSMANLLFCHVVNRLRRSRKANFQEAR